MDNRESMADSLKGFVNVIGGVAGASVMMLLVTRNGQTITFDNAVFTPFSGGLPFGPWVTLTLLLLFFIRFFHGNIRYIDIKNWPGNINSFMVSVEFLAMFIEGFCLAGMSFYFVERPREFYLLFTGSLVVDTLRALIRQAVMRDVTGKDSAWSWNNGVVALIMLLLLTVLSNWGDWAPAIVLLVNSLIAIFIDFSFFFPSFETQAAANAHAEA